MTELPILVINEIQTTKDVIKLFATWCLQKHLLCMKRNQETFTVKFLRNDSSKSAVLYFEWVEREDKVTLFDYELLP